LGLHIDLISENGSLSLFYENVFKNVGTDGLISPHSNVRSANGRYTLFK